MHSLVWLDPLSVVTDKWHVMPWSDPHIFLPKGVRYGYMISNHAIPEPILLIMNLNIVWTFWILYSESTPFIYSRHIYHVPQHKQLNTRERDHEEQAIHGFGAIKSRLHLPIPKAAACRQASQPASSSSKGPFQSELIKPFNATHMATRGQMQAFNFEGIIWLVYLSCHSPLLSKLKPS